MDAGHISVHVEFCLVSAGWAFNYANHCIGSVHVASDLASLITGLGFGVPLHVVADGFCLGLLNSFIISIPWVSHFGVKTRYRCNVRLLMDRTTTTGSDCALTIELYRVLDDSA